MADKNQQENSTAKTRLGVSEEKSWVQNKHEEAINQKRKNARTKVL